MVTLFFTLKKKFNNFLVNIIEKHTELKVVDMTSLGIVFMFGHGQQEVQTYDLGNFFERVLPRLFRKFKI